MKKFRKPDQALSKLKRRAAMLSSSSQSSSRSRSPSPVNKPTTTSPLRSSFLSSVLSIGNLIRLVGVILIVSNVAQNQDVLEFNVMTWMFFVVFGFVGVLFAVVYLAGFLPGRKLIVIFGKTVADFAILVAAIYSLVVVSAERGEVGQRDARYN